MGREGGMVLRMGTLGNQGGDWHLQGSLEALKPFEPFAIRDFQACSAQIQGIGNRGPLSPKVSRDSFYEDQ